MNYKISHAAYTGVSHRQRGEAGQDKTAFLKKGAVYCAALADGAGSKILSGRGAQRVTQTTARLFCEEFENLWQLSEDELKQKVIGTCIEQLEQLGFPLPELSSTLLFCAAHRDGRMITGHLGDGAMIWVPKEGEAFLYSTPENGEDVSQTFFVTGQQAQKHLRIMHQTLAEEGTLLFMSDGMAASLYQNNRGLPAPACRVMAGWLRDSSETEVNLAIIENMKTVFSLRSRDDLSLVIFDWQLEE